MKVTLINTTDAGGGAPAACMRLLKALEINSVDARLQVQEKKTSEPGVHGLGNTLYGRFKIRFNFFYERLPFIWLRAKEKSLRFAFSTASTGTDITKEKDIINADILHLHWINSGFLSIRDIEKLTEMGKPIVWTLHDMWAFTGGCHYAGDCDHFLNHCGNCWMLRYANDKDWSYDGWQRKRALLASSKNIVFVTCSNWLADVARKSSLLKDFRIEAIPNPIDTTIYAPQNRQTARGKWGISADSKVVLFGAANIMDRRKGISYLVDALNKLKIDYQGSTTIEVVIFGKNKSFDMALLPFKVIEVGIITSQTDLAGLYSLADVYVSPSIEDNLPNTIMESLACGTPVAAFNTGGIPDMVEHLNNGYLADYKSSKDLAAGIHYLLTTDKHEELGRNAREKVMTTFTNDIVAAKYIAVYQSVLPA
jgi:glycosyltransferase involved in cell wall biosynthesis